MDKEKIKGYLTHLKATDRRDRETLILASVLLGGLGYLGGLAGLFYNTMGFYCGIAVHILCIALVVFSVVITRKDTVKHRLIYTVVFSCIITTVFVLILFITFVRMNVSLWLSLVFCGIPFATALLYTVFIRWRIGKGVYSKALRRGGIAVAAGIGAASGAAGTSRGFRNSSGITFESEQEGNAALCVVIVALSCFFAIGISQWIVLYYTRKLCADELDLLWE